MLPNKLLAQIIDAVQRRKVAFFAGAGISNDWPANLPLAADFVKGVVSAICTSNVKLRKQQRVITNNLAGIRPEVMFQVLHDTLGTPALDVLDILRGGNPNLIHRFIAEVAKRNLARIVITTNFDSLIEKALQEEACDFRQLTTEEEFANRRRFRKVVTIGKLHGTLIAPDGKDRRSSIQATLAQVGQPFTPGKARFLQYIFRNYDVVFLGYSGLDDFDIFPLLASSKTDRTVYWLEHTNEEIARVVTSEEIAAVPFADRSNSERIISNCESGYKVIGNTANLIRELGIRLRFSPFMTRSKKKPTQDHHRWFRSWVSKSPVNNRAFFIIGRLMAQQRKWKAAVHYFSEAAEHDTGIHISRIFRNLGMAHMRLSEFPEAAKYYERSLKTQKDDQEFRATVLVSLGWIYYQEGDYGKAVKTLEESVVISKRGRAARAKALNNLGVALYRQEKWSQALRCFERSVSIKTKLGDIYGIAATIDNIGLVYAAKRDWKKADEHHNRSLRLFRSLGDPFGEAQTLDSIGELYLKKGDIRQSIEYLERSLRLKRKLGDSQVAGITLVNLGEAYSLSGDSDTALRLFGEAIELLKKVKAKRELAIAYQSLGRILKDVRYLKRSIQYFEHLGMRRDKKESERLLESV